MTLENDIVLIYVEGEPMVFARVERIVADHKPEWFQITFLLLTLPLKTITWILREAYINGAEFTMDGKSMRLEKVVTPNDPAINVFQKDKADGEAANDKTGETSRQEMTTDAATSSDAAGKDAAQVISFPSSSRNDDY